MRSLQTLATSTKLPASSSLKRTHAVPRLMGGACRLLGHNAWKSPGGPPSSRPSCGPEMRLKVEGEAIHVHRCLPVRQRDCTSGWVHHRQRLIAWSPIQHAWKRAEYEEFLSPVGPRHNCRPDVVHRILSARRDHAHRRCGIVELSPRLPAVWPIGLGDHGNPDHLIARPACDS